MTHGAAPSRVVFVPGLAERLFPRAIHEDPLLVDDLRTGIDGLLQQDGRAALERLSLRLTIGAATDRRVRVVPQARSGRGPRARAVVLCARSDARGDRERSRSREAGAGRRRDVERAARVARAARSDRRHRRLRTRPRGPSIADVRPGRVQGTRAVPGAAQRASAPIARFAMEPRAVTLDLVRWHRPRRRCRAAVPDDATNERSPVFGVGASALRRVSVPLPAVRDLPARADRDARRRCSIWIR